MSSKEDANEAVIARMLRERGVKEWEPEAMKLLVAFLEKQQRSKSH